MSKYIINNKNRIPKLAKDGSKIGQLQYPTPWTTVNGPTPSYWYSTYTGTNLEFEQTNVITSFTKCDSLNEWYSTSGGGNQTTVFVVLKEIRSGNFSTKNAYYYSSTSNHNSDQSKVQVMYNYDPTNPVVGSQYFYELSSNYYGGVSNKGQSVRIQFNEVATQSNCLIIISSNQYSGAPPGGVISYHRVNGVTGTVSNTADSFLISGCTQNKRNGFISDLTGNNTLEFIVYYSNLSAGDRTTVETYLKDKWNITY